MKTHPPELTRIAQNESPLFLREKKVIVLRGAEAGGFEAQLTAHAEVNAEPVAILELKEQLLPARFRAEQFLPNEMALERAHVGSAKNPLLSMQMEGENPGAQPWVPAFAKILDLGQLRHGRRLDRPEAPCYPWPAWKK
jgi:hypothetical protein